MDKESEAKKQESELLSEVGEDTTKYGEFISSYFAWVSLPQQKGRVNEFEEMTKKEEKNRLQFSWNACDCAGCFSPSGRTYAKK